MAAVTICSDFGAPQNKVSHYFHFSPSIYHEGIRPVAMVLVFWMLSFKPTFSLSSFTFIKSLLSSSSLSAIRVVPSAYLRLLIFLPATLIPACASSSLAFPMISMYVWSVYLYLCHYHVYLLKSSLRSVSVMLPAMFLFLNIEWLYGFLWFHTTFRIVLFMWKMPLKFW